MWRLIKFLFIFLVLAAIVLAIVFVGYAYLGPIFMPADFAPPIHDVAVPVTLDGS